MEPEEMSGSKWFQELEGVTGAAYGVAGTCKARAAGGFTAGEHDHFLVVKPSVSRRWWMNVNQRHTNQ